MAKEDHKEIIKEKGYCVIDFSKDNLIRGPISSKYTIVVMVLSGSVEYEMNMETLRAEANTCITFPHVSMLKTTFMSDDFHAYILVMEDNFAFEATVGIETERVHAVFRSPIIPVENEHEWKMLLSLMDGLLLYQSFPMSVHSREISGSLFRNLMLVFGELAAVKSVVNKNRGTTYSMSDNYFRNFINLLNDYVKTEHEVTFYANKLNITAKYLGEICKRKSGRKAKEIISAVLIVQLKRDITLSGKSMKVVAYEYGFADQSSLGKFFRKMTGESPREYRNKSVEIDMFTVDHETK